ncbi:MAG TPA: PKD domain-containing protein [Nitrososphaera sp.]
MMSKPLAAILVVALLLSASGTVGQLYFVSSQGQTPTEPAELILSESEASPGLAVEIEGTDFGADSSVSIYFMSAEPVDLTEGSAFILQGINANQSATIEPGGASTFFNTNGTALHTLGNLLQSTINQGGNNTTTNTTAGISGQNLLVVLEDGTPVNGTMSLDCEDVNIAQGRINGTIGTFGASPGIYEECSISITGDDTTNAGEIDELIISSDSEEDFANSLVTSATADEEGTFESSVTVPNVEGGEYAILAVADDGRMAISALSVIVAEPADEPVVNATTTANATEGGILNETLTPAPEEEEEELAEEESSEPLTAQITSNATEGTAPATFEFETNVTGGTEPYTYGWDFGDDTEGSDEQTVVHTFDEAGTYNVVATVTDSSGQTVSDSIEITVEELAPEGVEEETTTTTPTTPTTTTAQNQTDTSEEEPTVQVDETSAEPGSPLAIQGEGFQPDTPIQIFINNVPLTNVITNVEGSFNTVIIVPTTVAAGSAQVVVRSEQTNIIQNVDIISLNGTTEGPSTLRLTAVSATDNGEALPNARVTIFDASSGEAIERGRTPMDIELQEGTYSIFYSDFGRFEFESAEPGTWINTPNGGSGLITIREGRNTTVTALYSERPAPPPPPRVTDNSLTLRTQDTQGNLIQGMFVTIYDADAAEKIEQSFTELRVDDLPPGTYPIFFANFGELVFLSASPGTWSQTPFGGVGLVTIPDDGEDHNIVVTAQYNRTTIVEEQFNIQAPLDVEGNIFTITSNQTRPEGPFVLSGTFALRVSDEEPVSATLSAYFTSVREDSNENVDLESQRSRDHDTFQIVDLKPRVARPIGPNGYVISGTADLLLNGDMYSNDERVHVILRGGEELTPTNIEIDFRGDQRYSAANRLDTLYGVISSGFQ